MGEDTLVDKTVAERLYEPLAHQIRNAIDHGLEDPLERKRTGKNPTGRLTLTAYKKEGFTYISVADDGQGLDVDLIRQAAVRRGLFTTEEAAALSTPECQALIMHPGFSTRSEATEISGRGVGMDVVKNTVEELGGEVIIDSQPGQRTEFTFKIPQLSAVNITDALIIRAGEDFYAIPISNVVATQAFLPSEFQTFMKKAESILYLGSIIPLHDLRALLSGEKPVETTDVVPVIIIEAKNGRLALKVSEFIRPQKLVLIPLPDLFSVKGVSGTTILGGNQLGLVLDPFELIARATDKQDTGTEEHFLSRETVSWEERTEQDNEGPEPAAPGPVQPESPKESKDDSGNWSLDLDSHMAEEFLLEIKGILTELNEDIFQLEKDPENMRRLNTIFRHFHSIKGNLIMTGFTDLGGFVHQVESILDRMREKELEVSQEIIDILLDAVKTLETALEHINQGRRFEIADQELLDMLEKYRRPETPPEEASDDEDTFAMSPLSQLLLQAKTAQNANIFQSLIRFEPRFQEPYLVAYLILRRLALIGDIIDTAPSLDKIERGLVTESIKVLFATPHSQEEVDQFTRRQLMRHFDVVEFEHLIME